MATLTELAAMVEGVVEGDGEITITGLNDLERAGPGELAFLADSGRLDKLERCRASALIISRTRVELPQFNEAKVALLRVSNPYLAATRIQNFFLAAPFKALGVHSSAVIGENCRIPAEVSIAAGVILGTGVELGARVQLAAGAVIGDNAVLGDDVVIHPNVTLYPQTVIGHRVIIHAGSVIGSDGFGYATDGEGRHHKRSHLGRVRIEDDVEIGANVCIDRGTFGETLIKAGSKIDNLVQIAHNVEIGENSLVVAQVGIAGSTRLGRQVVLGGQTGVAGHLQIGAGVMVAAKSGVHNNQPAGAVIAGAPAIDHKKWRRSIVALARLPEMLRELRDLRRQLTELTAGERSEKQAGKETGNE